jgi:hypothetical protein
VNISAEHMATSLKSSNLRARTLEEIEAFMDKKFEL